MVVKVQWPLFNENSGAPWKLLVYINEPHMLHKSPYLFSYLLSEPGQCRCTSINITFPHQRGFILNLLDGNDVYTCACISGSPRFRTRPSLMMVPPTGRDAFGRTSRPASVEGQRGRRCKGPGCLQRFITGRGLVLILHLRTLL